MTWPGRGCHDRRQAHLLFVGLTLRGTINLSDDPLIIRWREPGRYWHFNPSTATAPGRGATPANPSGPGSTADPGSP